MMANCGSPRPFGSSIHLMSSSTRSSVISSDTAYFLRLFCGCTITQVYYLFQLPRSGASYIYKHNNIIYSLSLYFRTSSPCSGRNINIIRKNIAQNLCLIRLMTHSSAGSVHNNTTSTRTGMIAFSRDRSCLYSIATRSTLRTF